MKKRDLLKLGSVLFTTASLGAITGYGVSSLANKKAEVANDGSFSIEPEQTAPYEYSSPMPFNKALIDELYEINQNHSKGKITTLYSSLPSPLGKSIHPVLDSVRGDNYDIKTVDDYIDYVKYATEKGFKCVYVLNTTRPVAQNDEEIPKVIIQLFRKLYQEGISAVKIANPNILNIFASALPFIDIHLSTTSEYHHVQVYQNVLNTFPNIKLINIATDDNHNFEFLNSMRKLFPDVKLELLINESRCVKNCIARYYHQCIHTVAFPCVGMITNSPCFHLAKNNLIYPWQLEYYSAIGVNNFKFTSMPYSRNSIADVRYLSYYIDCIENGIENYTANDLMDKIMHGMPQASLIRFKQNYKLSKFIKEYLPDIKHFIKQGARCASDCGVNCKYCYEFADKLESFATRV